MSLSTAASMVSLLFAVASAALWVWGDRLPSASRDSARSAAWAALFVAWIFIVIAAGLAIP